jgi:REP element-mobilizing transposase RayT
MDDTILASHSHEERLHRRAPIHLPIHLPVNDLGNRPNIVFVTVCTKNRKPILAFDDVHAILLDAWRAHGAWQIGRYVIMPDHIHLFCAPSMHEHPALVRWISAWKAQVTKVWPRPLERPVWQRSFWDRQLRRGESYSAKWEYVCGNPVRHGLVESAGAWPFQGEMELLKWHEP